MAKLLGINAPLDSTGNVLYEALKQHPHPPKTIPLKREDTEALANAATIRYWDKDASGKTVTSLLSPMASLEVTNIPASRDLIILYNTEIDGKLSLYANNKYIRDIFFPATGYSPSRYAARTLNLSLDQNDTLKLVNDPTHNCTGINIDCFIFRSKSPNEREYLPLEPPTPAAPEPEKPEPSLATQTPDDSF